MIKKIYSIVFIFAFVFLFSFIIRAQQKDLTSDLQTTPEEKEFLKSLQPFQNKPEDYEKTLNEKLGLSLSPNIQKKWIKYLKEVISSDLKTERVIFIKVNQAYNQSIKAYEEKLKPCTYNLEDESPYIEDLTNKFGKSYVKRNKPEIQSIVLSLQMNKEWKCLENERKELLQAEAQYHEVVKSQLFNILHFFESTDFSEIEKTQIASRIQNTKIYYNLLNKTSIASLIFSDGKLRIEEKMKEMPQDLFYFLRKYYVREKQSK